MTLLDYGAGNVRSVRNAIRALGYDVLEVSSPADILSAERLIFPGVGAFGGAMRLLRERGYDAPLAEYVRQGRPFLGICIGMQVLFEGSEESPGVAGLGLIPGQVTRFGPGAGPVPHMGWSGISPARPHPLLAPVRSGERVYFVHSYRVTPTPANRDWVLATTDYGGAFAAAVGKGQVVATQFHPEKSGALGLEIVRAFLDGRTDAGSGPAASAPSAVAAAPAAGLAKRVIACMDVRANDAGDLVVTKGDQYDVREKKAGVGGGGPGGEGGEVRNLGKPVELAGRYFLAGADEITFLNITGFRDFPLLDAPMLEVLRRASETIFVPLTVGGGIRDFVDGKGRSYSALEVASEYFRSGADKISIGTDAVAQAEAWYARGKVADGTTAIERISAVYGRQAVVVSIDPRRVYVADPASVPHRTVRVARPGPAGEQFAWWQCTVAGGREGRPLGAFELAVAAEALGAGEILLNCIDRDGRADGFDCELVGLVASAVSIPVIASSGAGKPEHFSEVFARTGAAAALAAGIFHRGEVSVGQVKERMHADGVATRL